MFEFINGYKTHIVVVAYVAFLVYTGTPLEEDVIFANLDLAGVQSAFGAIIVSTLRSAANSLFGGVVFEVEDDEE